MSEDEQKAQMPQEVDKELEFNSMLNDLNEEDKAFAEEELRRAIETDKQNTAATPTDPENTSLEAAQATTVTDMLKYQFKKGMELARERGHYAVTEDGKVREAPTNQDMQEAIKDGFDNTSFGKSVKDELAARRQLALKLAEQEEAKKKAKTKSKKKVGNFISSLVIFIIVVGIAIYFIIKK